MRSPRTRAVSVAALCLLAATAVTPAEAATEPVHLEGTLGSGATWVMDVPADWNGTVLLFSHGYRPQGSPNPAQNAPNGEVASVALEEGYALIGSSYATTGWAAAEAVPDQLATLAVFTRRFGPAERTVAWGQSYGGLVTTALAERHPGHFDGTLSMCGLVHGGVANWNSTLDPVFAIRTLLAPDADLPLVRFADQQAAAGAADTYADAVARAQETEAGRARLALAAALHNIPGHNQPGQPAPAPGDFEGQQANQYEALRGLGQTAAFTWRQEAEARAGGNPSWNTGVDYRRMLARSANATQVKALYKSAGRSLDADLNTLADTPRIGADPRAVDYMKRHVSFTGKLTRPQLTIHTTGDALVPVQAESAYRDAAARAGRLPLLRQAYVDRPGHCTFTTGEQLAALHALHDRITTGHWGDTGPDALNARARAVEPDATHGYAHYRPGPYPRPYIPGARGST